MKKLFRASYCDESKVLLILADDLEEAIKIANDSEIGKSDPFDFGEEDQVFEIDLNKHESQIIESFTIECFI